MYGVIVHVQDGFTLFITVCRMNTLHTIVGGVPLEYNLSLLLPPSFLPLPVTPLSPNWENHDWRCVSLMLHVLLPIIVPESPVLYCSSMFNLSISLSLSPFPPVYGQLPMSCSQYSTWSQVLYGSSMFNLSISPVHPVHGQLPLPTPIFTSISFCCWWKEWASTNCLRLVNVYILQSRDKSHTCIQKWNAQGLYKRIITYCTVVCAHGPYDMELICWHYGNPCYLLCQTHICCIIVNVHSEQNWKCTFLHRYTYWMIHWEKLQLSYVCV